MGEGLKREEENKLRYFDVIARFGLHRGDLDPRLLRIPLKLEGHGKSTAIGKTVEEVCASALEWLQERDPEQWGKNPKADFMKKEASEQTTVSGKDQYCPCYTYVDGNTDPDCPMHGRKRETQTPLSRLLDEIDERAEWKLTLRKGNPGAADWGEIYFGNGRSHRLLLRDAEIIRNAHNRTDVPALVKALRRAMIVAKTMPAVAYEVVTDKARVDLLPNDLQADYDTLEQEVAAILNQK